MGVLLKEALKALCRSNRWSYAVFWKIGCQNPKLLIWEECHYEPSSLSQSSGSESANMPSREWEGCWASSVNCATQLGVQEDRVQALINKMMLNNQIRVVGEGIVGRAAFTGNHQWLLSNNFTGDAHPPEVLKEVHQQFLAGMKTLAVVPVPPHGVVQLGSAFYIMDNMGFVNDVKSLFVHLGGVPGALLSENYSVKDPIEKIGVPVTLGMPVSVDPSGNCKVINSSLLTDSSNQQGNLSQDHRLIGQLSHSLTGEIQNNQHATASTFPDLATFSKIHDDLCKPGVAPMMKPKRRFGDNLEYGDIRAEVIPQKPNPWLNQQVSSSSVFNYTSDFGQSSGHGGLKYCIRPAGNSNTSATNSFNIYQTRTNEVRQSSGINRHINLSSSPCSLPNTDIAANSNLFGIPYFGRVEVHNTDLSKTGEVSLSSVGDHLSVHMFSGSSDDIKYSADAKHLQNGLSPMRPKIDDDLFQALSTSLPHPDDLMSLSDQIPSFGIDYQNQEYENESQSFANVKNDKTCGRPFGDDLFDILGVEYKNKLLNMNRNNLVANRPDENTQNTDAGSLFTNMHDEGMCSDAYSMSEGIFDIGIFSGTSSDHLLDAVVSRGHSAAKQTSNDNMSCRTSLTKIGSSIVPTASSNHGRASVTDRSQHESFGFPNHHKVTLQTSPFRSECSKDDLGNCSQTTSVNGSQISSWVEQAHQVKRENSVSTGYSKKPDEQNKSSRKRLKPGENPRPRPKDRQMIQDRVKELREIVPNGAKCSIDALLERTIKHMLFLQSVTKHADKLKQTGDSKLICKNGGLFLKDSFESGATWAFEVGSQSMVCPIIVEDLNPPRQFLVEMLCEERGLFLEIADLIKGLGLTILKGVMEARDDKIWARFAVEANRDMTRMEIFMSLVHLLEPVMKGRASLANVTDNSHMIIHNSFPQAAAIPATGMPSSLQ